MPPVEHPQYGGKAGCSVVDATVDWLAAPSARGGEIDLEKAFDSVQHDAAEAALLHRGTPPQVAAFLRKAVWAGKRLCNVDGELAGGLWPCASVPPGDPRSMDALAALLSPWPAVVSRAAPVLTWLFVDDRSLKVRQGTQSPDEALERALDATRRFDDAIGARENASKRQSWEGEGLCEHLGLRLSGLCTASSTDTRELSQAARLPLPQTVPLPALRDGWDPVLAAIGRLALVPATLAVREKLAECFINSRWQWAAPLLPVPGQDVTKAVYAAVLRTGCTWWCKARFFAERLSLHPQLGTAVRCCTSAEGVSAWRAPLAHRAVSAHAAALLLTVVRFDATGLWLAPAQGSDARVVAAAAAAEREARADALRQGHAPPPRLRGQPAFRPSLPAGAHAARVAGRVVALAGAAGTRHDVEGLGDADVELLSHPRWRAWKRSLCDQDACALAVWRGGAVLTPTRRWSQRCAHREACPWCPEPRASARHLFSECPRLEEARRQLQREHRLPAGWWASQPRALAKSGWLPRCAAASSERRVELLIAANKLGVKVAQLGSELQALWGPSSSALDASGRVAA